MPHIYHNFQQNILKSHIKVKRIAATRKRNCVYNNIIIEKRASIQHHIVVEIEEKHRVLMTQKYTNIVYNIGGKTKGA